MAKYSEDTFNGWRMPPSSSEESKLDVESYRVDTEKTSF